MQHLEFGLVEPSQDSVRGDIPYTNVETARPVRLRNGGGSSSRSEAGVQQQQHHHHRRSRHHSGGSQHARRM